MSNVDRFKDIPWFKQTKGKNIIIGGAGGIGSWMALLLARQQFDILLVDYDTVEAHNMGGQFFKNSDINIKKVQAVETSVYDYARHTINTYDGRYDETFAPVEDFMIAGFDNMEARKFMFEQWCNHVTTNNIQDAMFIDGRMMAEGYIAYFIQNTPEMIEAYKATLFNSSDIEDEVCTMKATTFSATMLCSRINSILCNYLYNIQVEQDIREIPFMVREDLANTKRVVQYANS